MNNNEQGSILVMVILIIAVLSILGTAFLTLSVDENKFAIKEHDYQQAYYIARAGAEATAIYMEKSNFDNTDLKNLLGGKASNNPSVDFGEGSFKTSINKAKVTVDENSANRLIIESIGEFKGMTRTVKLSLELQKLFPGNAPLISLNELSLNNSSAIYGDVLVKKNFSQGKKDSLNSHIKDGGSLIYDPDLSFPNPVNPGLSPIAASIDFKKTHLYISSGSAYEDKNLRDVNLPANSSITFDLNGDMNIQMESLDTDNKGDILVKGNGMLYLFVGGINQIRGKIEVEDNAKLLIINYKADDFTIKTSSDAFIEAFIYAPLSTVTITNKLNITGSILADTISVNNSTKIKYGEVGIFPDDILIEQKSYIKGIWSY